MADEWIVPGSTFTVTLDTTDPVTGLPLITLTDFSGHLIKLRRPDGRRFSITPDTVTATTLVGTVSTTLNPESVSGADGKWKDGYAGPWEFRPYCVGGSGQVFKGKQAVFIIHPEWSTPQ